MWWVSEGGGSWPSAAICLSALQCRGLTSQNTAHRHLDGEKPSLIPTLLQD